MPPDRAAAQADALSVGVALSDEQADRLLAYVALLQHWNATYNLTAVREPTAMWRQHVLDCLAAVPSIRARRSSAGRMRVLDVGSGGGLPGVVWAVVMPEADLTCLDAVGKKTAFIRQAAGSLVLKNLQALHARVESVQLAPFDLITSRAFASLADFVKLTWPLLATTGSWVAMKGKPADDELAALDRLAVVFHVEPLAVPGLGAERCLVWIERAG